MHLKYIAENKITDLTNYRGIQTSIQKPLILCIV